MKEQLSEIKTSEVKTLASKSDSKSDSKIESGNANMRNNEQKSESQNDAAKKDNIKFVRIRDFTRNKLRNFGFNNYIPFGQCV